MSTQVAPPIYRELPKQPEEEVRFAGIDFAPQIEPSESIVSWDVQIEEELHMGDPVYDRTVEMLVDDELIGTTVVPTIMAGDDNIDYVANLEVVLSSGRVLEGVIKFGVRDRPA